MLRMCFAPETISAVGAAPFCAGTTISTISLRRLVYNPRARARAGFLEINLLSQHRPGKEGKKRQRTPRVTKERRNDFPAGKKPAITF